MKPEIKEELDKIKNLKEVYDSLVASHTEVYYAQENVKDSENSLKEKIAMEKQFYKKDGTTLDLAKVKMPSLNGAITVFLGGEDKLEAAADLKNEYLADIKKGVINQKEVESLEMKRNLVKETSSGAKDAREELKTHIDPLIVDAIDMLAKEEVKILKENDDADKGVDKKPKKEKDTSATYEILKEIKTKLGII